jgi:hypothetical protein
VFWEDEEFCLAQMSGTVIILILVSKHFGTAKNKERAQMTGSEFRGTIILQEGTPPISHFREDGVG